VTPSRNGGKRLRFLTANSAGIGTGVFDMIRSTIDFAVISIRVICLMPEMAFNHLRRSGDAG